jgi:hypothetical protein
MIAILLGLLFAAPPQAAYRIAGVVVNAASQQPVNGATLAIGPLEQRDRRLTAVTGPDGRFVFANVARGKYVLTAQRRGLLSQQYGQNSGFGTAIVTGPGQDTEHIVFAMPPPAIISGRVVDEAGEPVPHAQVALLASRIVNGRRQLLHVRSEVTDDLGDYRVASLTQGTYYLAVSGFPWYVRLNRDLNDSPPDSITHSGYGIKYYPNGSDPTSAEALPLKAGQEAIVNFALLPVVAASVHIHVDADKDIEKLFMLSTAGLRGCLMAIRAGTASYDTYNFWGIPPGHYTSQVVVRETARMLYAKNEIDVGTTDVDVTATLQEAPSLAATIEWEGGGAMPQNLMGMLYNEEEGGPGGRYHSARMGKSFFPESRQDVIA